MHLTEASSHSVFNVHLYILDFHTVVAVWFWFVIHPCFPNVLGVLIQLH